MEEDAQHILYAELQDKECDLLNDENHKEGRAIDYIYQKCTFGDISIAICEECVRRLSSDNWILLFCINCTRNMWIYKPTAKKPHLYKDGEHIIWMSACHHCSKSSL